MTNTNSNSQEELLTRKGEEKKHERRLSESQNKKIRQEAYLIIERVKLLLKKEAQQSPKRSDLVSCPSSPEG